MTIQEEILTLKKKHNALILAHFYEDGDIQDLADYCGDSLFLAQKGQECDNPVVLMAGVVFMGEGIKLLSPEKKVLVPDLDAGCSLVHHSPYEKYKAWRDNHPDSILVSYINSSAAAKSVSDIICTSSNAEKIIASIPPDRSILFGPDQNLGKFLAKQTGREMTMWPGACEVRVLFSAKKLFSIKREHPNAVTLAHPECMESVLQYADVIGSTSRLINEVSTNPATEFIIATEPGVIHQMQKLRPDALLIPAPPEGNCACNECPYMKLNTLTKIKHALETLAPEIILEERFTDRARLPLQRMMDVSAGRSINWDRIGHA